MKRYTLDKTVHGCCPEAIPDITGIDHTEKRIIRQHLTAAKVQPYTLHFDTKCLPQEDRQKCGWQWFHWVTSSVM